MSSTPVPVYLRRFDTTDRLLHGVLMLSFLGLAFTGLPLLFSDEGWARVLARIFGGFQVAGWFHRLAAILLIGVFLTHLTRVSRRVFKDQHPAVLWGPHSMVPQPRDVTDFVRHVLWFVGRGPRPQFDRFTYWEKFDYWAVFWGMAIIGGSGLLLWFPEMFARVVPGWVFNVAMLIHGEEALLAVGFIFTLHFFNSHLRPEKFPMDPVIFTGRVTAEELKAERPAEYARLARHGGFDRLQAGPPPQWVVGLAKTIAIVAVSLGLIMVVLILYAFLN
jgi:cytochrome b subunit of formate dehydrogenase